MTNSIDSMAEPKWMTIRNHQTRLEAPDIIIFKVMGDITQDDVDEFVRIIRPWPKPSSGFFYISDLTNIGSHSEQAPMRIRALPANFIRATAVIGATFRHRVWIDMMTRSSRVLGPAAMQAVPHPAASYEEAYAFFDQRRHDIP